MHGSGGLHLIQDSDHRASWPQLSPEDHLQGLGGGGGGGQLKFRYCLNSFVLMNKTFIRSDKDIFNNKKK
jgi:hypothetical protein